MQAVQVCPTDNLLQLLIDEVDDELIEAVHLEDLEAVNLNLSERQQSKEAWK